MPEGEPLLVLHGWGMNSSVWQIIAENLENYFQVTWLDLPGHGDNKGVNADNLADIVALIIPLLTPSSHLMGWSLGGLIAQEIIRQRPDLVKQAIMVASTPQFSQTKRWQYAMPKEQLTAFSEGLIKDTQGTLKRFIALQFMGVKGSQPIQRALREAILVRLPNEKALRLGLDLLQQQRFLAVAMPQQTLWILGGKDRLIPIEMHGDLKRLYPTACIKVIESAGHAPFMTHPQSFIESVLHFLGIKITTNERCTNGC